MFEAHIGTLSAKLDAYDQILSKQKYLAGDVSTIFVLNIAPFLTVFFFFGRR